MATRNAAAWYDEPLLMACDGHTFDKGKPTQEASQLQENGKNRIERGLFALNTYLNGHNVTPKKLLEPYTAPNEQERARNLYRDLIWACYIIAASKHGTPFLKTYDIAFPKQLWHKKAAQLFVTFPYQCGILEKVDTCRHLTDEFPESSYWQIQCEKEQLPNEHTYILAMTPDNTPITGAPQYELILRTGKRDRNAWSESVWGGLGSLVRKTVYNTNDESYNAKAHVPAHLLKQFNTIRHNKGQPPVSHIPIAKMMQHLEPWRCQEEHNENVERLYNELCTHYDEHTYRCGNEICMQRHLVRLAAACAEKNAHRLNDDLRAACQKLLILNGKLRRWAKLSHQNKQNTLTSQDIREEITAFYTAWHKACKASCTTPPTQTTATWVQTLINTAQAQLPDPKKLTTLSDDELRTIHLFSSHDCQAVATVPQEPEDGATYPSAPQAMTTNSSTHSE